MNVDAAIAAIDALHRQDPAGRELAYADTMSRWLVELNNNPEPLLTIAVRAQHLKRWECPRSDFPTGRKGYLKWRQQAAAYHADLVAGILEQWEFDEVAIQRVIALVKKRGLGRDKDVQTLEDCACLTFLEQDLGAFRTKHSPSKVDEVLEKTWRKMSPAAQQLAGTLSTNP